MDKQVESDYSSNTDAGPNQDLEYKSDDENAQFFSVDKYGDSVYNGLPMSMVDRVSAACEDSTENPQSSTTNSESVEYLKCAACCKPMRNPRYLSCLHPFCEDCIQLVPFEQTVSMGENKNSVKSVYHIHCKVCKQITKVGDEGVNELVSGNGFKTLMATSKLGTCYVCAKLLDLVAYCNECRADLCSTCDNAHKLLYCYENHTTVKFADRKKEKIDELLCCARHPDCKLCFYCYDCEIPICKECFRESHKGAKHNCDIIAFAQKRERNDIELLMNKATSKSNNYVEFANISNAVSEMEQSGQRACDKIVDTYRTMEHILAKFRDIALKNLDENFQLQKDELILTAAKVENENDEDGSKKKIPTNIKNEIMQNKSTPILNTNVEAYFNKIADCFGKVKVTETVAGSKTNSPISPQRTSSPLPDTMRGGFEGSLSSVENSFTLPNDLTQSSVMSTNKDNTNKSGSSEDELEVKDMYKKIANNSSLNVNAPIFCMRDSSASSDTFIMPLKFGAKNSFFNHSKNNWQLAKLDGDMLLTSQYGKRLKKVMYTASDVKPLNVRFMFGVHGFNKLQFNIPHGFCLSKDDDIVVADTNNHRIVVYDKHANFKFQFGVPGKEEGQLWFPRKVTTLPTNKKFVVCDRGSERSRMQIFSRTGHFLRKVSIRYIDIVAGLAITSKGHIVAIDSVSPTVFIISEEGDLLHWFDCTEYMCEPSDVATRNMEIYISDFKGHSVSIFNEDGRFLYRIGGPDITCFPNGIDISAQGCILVGDSHGNRFHVNCFSREGEQLAKYECPLIKVSRCCGLKLTSEGYVVTLAKNNNTVLLFALQK
ncbi:B-box type zinc finger protein ncl-1-like [Teleopsis dalmanni]|uniref:B-box type zinc finger protein ncl-1-like n=1 Tax=Teleopsis dalmanni TaxID=139649 RepID=UPI0018CD44BB|nr:B-box type zinc finger protein ncl-1-like [Teleopsis dalmanni]XP_037936981.1 B-box type zinc finger protein ncl-1-like [Teleopsis dalmanni]XP_037936982.1 B-box type zinc finger protein ncl-1-like [Teleopsis dalmanni]